jgi:protein-tyrosine-phosphatase
VTVDPLQAVAKSSKDVFRKIVPEFLLQQRGIVRRLGPGAGRVYISLRLLDMLGIRIANQSMAPPAARSFVFVCFGNLMRSAMAEFAMRQTLKEAGLEDQVGVVSAGLHASPGREAHPWAQQACAEIGISLADHRAKLVTQEMVEQVDCIFAMDFQNKAELLTLYPDARKKILMLSAYAEGPGQYREIDDPYFGDLETTRLCCQQLQTCVRNLVIRTFPSSADSIRQVIPKK